MGVWRRGILAPRRRHGKALVGPVRPVPVSSLEAISRRTPSLPELRDPLQAAGWYSGFWAEIDAFCSSQCTLSCTILGVSYPDKMRDPRWRAKRNEIEALREFRCEECQRTHRQNQVHHVYYIPRTEPWDHPNELLMLLCEECHPKRQHYEVQIHKNLAAIIRNMSIEEIKRQPIWTMFEPGTPIPPPDESPFPDEKS